MSGEPAVIDPKSIVWDASPAGVPDVSTIRWDTPAGPTAHQALLASPPMRVLQGARDPIDAQAQLLVHALPDGVVSAVNAGTRWVNELPLIGPVTKALGMTPASTAEVDRGISQQEAEYEAARHATGQTGTDWWRLAGNVVSPANAEIPIGGIAAARTIPALAAAGAKAGIVGGVMQPVTNPEGQQNFWASKGVQAGTGALTGGIATPIASKILGVVVPRVQQLLKPGGAVDPDQVVRQALSEAGISAEDMTPAQLEALKRQALDAASGRTPLDPAAAMRKQDFEALGMQPTLGQITRDPMQFARERNLRGIEGVGELLQARFTAQNRQLADTLAGYGGRQATDAQSAGDRLADALRNFDKDARSQIGSAYEAARAATGTDLEVPLHGFAQDYAKIVADYGEDTIPSAIRRQAADLGLLSGKQQRTFNLQDAEDFLRVVNKNVNPANRPQTAALGELRDAVKRAIQGADDNGGPFAVPRQMAADRFALEDALPALKRAATGSANPDRFVQQYVVGAPTPQVKMLAELLRKTDPASLEVARNQVGAVLERAAFGENQAGDAVLRHEALARTLRQIGPEKLSAFYSPQEVDQLMRAARVGAYINASPQAATVNASNTAPAWANIVGPASWAAGKIPLIGPIVRNTIEAGAERTARQQAVAAALAAQVPAQAAKASPQADRLVRALLRPAGILGAAQLEQQP